LRAAWRAVRFPEWGCPLQEILIPSIYAAKKFGLKHLFSYLNRCGWSGQFPFRNWKLTKFKLDSFKSL